MATKVDIATITMDRTLPERLKVFSKMYPNREACILIGKGQERHSYTFKTLYERSVQIAKALVNFGISKGDIIGIGVDSPYNWLVVSYGAIMAGAIPLYLEFFLKDGTDVIQILDAVKKCHLIIIEEGEGSFRSNICKILVGDVEQGKVSSMKCPSVEYIFVFGDALESCNFPMLNSLFQESKNYTNLPWLDSDDVAALLATSGSTGPSKIAMHSHLSLLTNGEHLCKALKLSTDHSFLNVLNFNWMGGFPLTFMSNGIPQVTFNGASLNIEDKMEIIGRCIEQERCTSSLYFPRLIELFLARESVPQKKLKTLGTGGCPIPQKCSDACGLITEEFVSLYGSTEGGFMCSSRNVTIADQFVKHCVGKPFPNVELKIVDGRDDTVEDGMMGEIYVRHSGLFKGYVNETAKTKAVMTKDQWYKTGDLGFINVRGDVIVKGRRGEVYTFGSDAFNVEMITPSDIEDSLRTHEDVVDVSALPKPDTDTGTMFYAFIETNSQVITREDMNAHFSNYIRVIPSVPFICRFMSKLPRTNNGKVDKKALKVLMGSMCKDNNLL